MEQTQTQPEPWSQALNSQPEAELLQLLFDPRLRKHMLAAINCSLGWSVHNIIAVMSVYHSQRGKIIEHISRPNKPPKNAHVLIPRTCECIILDGKRDFAHVIKLRILRWGDDTGLFR